MSAVYKINWSPKEVRQAAMFLQSKTGKPMKEYEQEIVEVIKRCAHGEDNMVVSDSYLIMFDNQLDKSYVDVFIRPQGTKDLDHVTSIMEK